MRLSSYPLDVLLRKRRALRRELISREPLTPIRIAVLGGSTTHELAELFELFLLDAGFNPTFYESPYGQFYEAAVIDPKPLIDFAPNIIYIHTCSLNLQPLPSALNTEQDLQSHLDAQLNRFRAIWGSLRSNLNCPIIQNNFEIPPVATLGNLDAVAGATRFISELNRGFAAEAASDPRLILQDLCSISARIGLDNWFDPERWFSFKLANTVEATVAIAKSLTALVNAVYGRTRKVLALDLDNTLWGGVIGDDGLDGIIIGRETALAEAYTAFQQYCLSLRDRGILLAVCSKNENAIAQSGFTHPDSVLKLEHFAAFRANWEAKHENLLALAQELNLGLDSFVFIDDNPAERAIVEAQLPQVAVPNISTDVARFPFEIEAGRYFETISLSKEDLARSHLYRQNADRAAAQQQFADYGEYLDSLEMTAEIDTLQPVYLERIAQLTNKTNQFNLTTRRYSVAEIQSIAGDPSCIALYGKLADRFGDNGLISVVIGKIQGHDLHLDLWLMSCRVLKRDMELAMLDAIAERAQHRALQRLIGYYHPTPKNALVADLYHSFGFCELSRATDGSTTWTLDLASYSPRTQHIKIAPRSAPESLR